MSLTTCRNAVLLVYLTGTCVAYGQRISYGVEGGVSTLEPTRENQDESRRYVVGATIEVGLWRGFAVEADFLYRHNGFSDRFNFGPVILGGSDQSQVSVVSASNRIRLDVFELPVLGKYYFRRDAKVQPFVLTGYSFRKALTNVDSSTTIQSSTGLSTQASNFSDWTSADVGATFGVGLRWRTGRISLKPEIRYTYWGAHPSIGVSKQQADVLVGITF
jgi:hypothetical protein